MTTFVRLPSAALLRAALLSIFPQEASTLDPLFFGLVLEDLIESAVVPLRTQVSASLLAHVHGTRLFPCVHVCVCASAAVVVGRTPVSASLLAHVHRNRLCLCVHVCVCMYVCGWVRLWQWAVFNSAALNAALFRCNSEQATT